MAARWLFATLTSLCVTLVFGLAAPGALAVTPPVVEDESVLDVAATSVTLQALVNPNGSETTYRFEYGTSEAYGSTVPAPDGLVGSGSTGVTVSAHLQGLTPHTTYHFRVVAVVPSRSESVPGGDASFTTQTAGSEMGLLDGRQWEMVSPPNKHGASIPPPAYNSTLIQGAEDGHAFAWVANAPTEAEPEGYANEVRVFSERGPNGWSSKDISPPRSFETAQSAGVGDEHRFFSPDLSLSVVEPQAPQFTPLSADATDRTPYIRKACESASGACYTPLVTAANVPPGTDFGGEPNSILGSVGFVDGTPDLSHIVLESEKVGLTSTPGDEGGLYEWVAGQLQMVSVLPENEGKTPVGGVLGYRPYYQNARNALSADGSRIFWSENGHRLYLRDTVKGETLRIGSGEALFQTASSDGSHVFFIGRADSSEPAALDECDVVEVSGKLACTITQLAPEIQDEVSAASQDGSSVYFVSNAVLAPGAVAGACHESNLSASASCNLYLEHRGSGGWGSPKLIAVLAARDQSDWGEPNRLTVRLSGNDRWLAFMSQRSLTGYDTRDTVSGELDSEVYVYDTSTERLKCASCNPTGERPTGRAPNELFLGGGEEIFGSIAASIPSWRAYWAYTAVYQPRYLSDDGRLFFNARDALVPQDVNGTWDVYEYEPPGVISCTPASVTFDSNADGCVDLVSSGASSEQSAFLDASGSGDDVFFMTTSHLTAGDVNTSYDVYDAHACSVSSPCSASAVSPPPCSTGDSCKTAPSPQPASFGAPASATFSGSGNVAGPSSESVVKRSLTRAQQLRRALQACHGKKSKHRRVECERRVRKQYRAKKATGGSR